MTRSRPRSIALSALMALTVGITLLAPGCGVPLDSSPRAITRTTLDARTSTGRETPTTSASPTAIEVAAYFLRDETLESRQFRVDAQPTLSQILAFVFGDPPAGLTTSIPSGTRLLSAKAEGGVATIDLTSEINDVSGQSQKQAYAQIVFSALRSSQVPGIAVREVRFMVDGKSVDAPTDNGNRAAVTEADYQGALHPTE